MEPGTKSIVIWKDTNTEEIFTTRLPHQQRLTIDILYDDKDIYSAFRKNLNKASPPHVKFGRKILYLFRVKRFKNGFLSDFCV